MTSQHSEGTAEINGAQIYFEQAGSGTPLVMIHAGVADSRQWNHEFPAFATDYAVLRYDLRGYGRSDPVAGDFRHLADLEALLDHLAIREPAILMGCSMGGGLAIEYALAHPERTRALVLVGSGPNGLDLDVPSPPAFAAVEAAYEAGDLGRVAELETQVWFDGIGRTADQVDPAMRRLALEMNIKALGHEAKKLGRRLPDADTPAAERLDELSLPVLVIVGEHDVPYCLAAADLLSTRLSNVRTVILPDAAHLANMDQPEQFRQIVGDFLGDVTGGHA